MVRNEYLRFLQSDALKAAPSETRKLANLLFDHLDELQRLGTPQGRRVKKIVELATLHWDQLSEEPKNPANATNSDGDVARRLTSVDIGPFRGFSKKETMNLDSDLVLVFGPNGTGKSSFCEALEYGLLGSVEEAQSKRFSSQPSYLRNAHVNKFTPPLISGSTADHTNIPVSPNDTFYRFSFVDKNRIDSFSRIAAHTPAKQTELISSLFGLESFYSFIKGFSQEIDERHLDTVGKQELQLAEKRQALKTHEQALESNKVSLDALTKKETALANQIQENMTFSQLFTYLGTDECPGRIQKLESILQKTQPPVTNLSSVELQKNKLQAKTAETQLSLKSEELIAASKELSFRELYSSIVELQGANKEECPACRTPLSQATNNPYALAESELVRLSQLSEIQSEVESLTRSFHKEIGFIYDTIRICVEQNVDTLTDNPLNNCLIADDEELNLAWWQTIAPNGTNTGQKWLSLEEQVQNLERRDTTVQAENRERESWKKELTKLRNARESAIRLQEQRKGFCKTTQDSVAAINSFDSENKKLILAAKSEPDSISFNRALAAAYRDIVRLLIAYRDKLPGLLIADLGDLVVDLYNSFNRIDPRTELLHSIKLPFAPGERIEISFQGNKEKHFDALHILSEGHIRCIGLAILLAKNIKSGSSLLIFDDPVNAIDDEHRNSIRETLFNDSYFNDTQIILACHGNEFFKNILQLLGKAAEENAILYKFLPQAGENHLQVTQVGKPTNYVLAASEFLNELEHRNALMSSRRALEHLTEKAWYHYSKHCSKSDKPISVSRRGPHLPWDLRVLVENLKNKFSKSKATIPNNSAIVSSLTSLLGTSGSDPHWMYLNKGTHEDSNIEEFEHDIVSNIVNSLIELDEALLPNSAQPTNT